MPKRGEYKMRLPVGDLTDPLGMARAVADFLEELKVKNFSESTIITYERHLRYFIGWCEMRGLMRPAEITEAILVRYQRAVSQIEKPNGNTICFLTQQHYLVPVRQFFRWLAKSHRILFNPASELELPRKERRLPKTVLSMSEAEQVINGVPLSDPMGLRDRAILETFYSTGMRRMELIGLLLYDVDFDRGTVMIRQGKGKKDRVIPIGERALIWIQKYVNDLRPSLLSGSDSSYLFLTNDGESLTPHTLSHMVRFAVDAAQIGKRGSCHIFRHTMATLMLEGGADVRYVQEMLGHVDLSTTQIYTRVSIAKLKEIHTSTHPGANMKSNKEGLQTAQPD
jgi:integrase/recombinase XerD